MASQKFNTDTVNIEKQHCCIATNIERQWTVFLSSGFKLPKYQQHIMEGILRRDSVTSEAWQEGPNGGIPHLSFL